MHAVRKVQYSFMRYLAERELTKTAAALLHKQLATLRTAM
jgi:hypothetical protein